MADNNVGVSVLCPAFVSTGIADSTRNMPAEVAASLPEITSQKPLGALIRDLVKNGISPTLVADAVLDAVQNNKFWILTHEQNKPGLIEKANDIVNGVNPTTGIAFV